ncbi:unnamed protein product, partial [marine sediment metagenome]
DIDAMILVTLDDNPENNYIVEFTYTPPQGGQQKVAQVDLGDGILFSLDPEEDLPYANAGGSTSHFRPSIPTEYVWFSSFGGFSTLDNVISHLQLGLTVGHPNADDIDALAHGQFGCEIPEPATLLLLGTGTLLIVGAARRRRIRS